MRSTNVALILLIALAVSSCGKSSSGSSSATVPTSNPSSVTISTPTPPTTTPSTTLINIQTYERKPDRAYPAIITSEIAQLSTENISVEIPTTTNEYSQLSFSKSGYIPSQYPYRTQDNQLIQLGLYSPPSTNKQSNFVKAIIPTDAGGWLMDYYNGGYFPSTTQRVKGLGANTIVYADSAIIKSMDVSAKTVTLYGKYFPADSVIADLGNIAKSNGVELTFMLGIYPGDTLGNDSWTVPKFYNAVANFSATDVFWDAFFASYKTILVERAALAQKVGATRFIIGFNLGFMVNKGNQRWADLIAAIRSAGFTGKISYFAGAYGSSNDFLSIPDSNTRSSFIKLFDEVGLDFNAPIAPIASEVLSADQARNSVLSSIKNQVSSISGFGVPIFLMIATPSVHDGMTSSDYIEPALTCDLIAASGKTRDYQTQSDVYEAAAELINSQATSGPSPIKGLFSWGYHYIDNPRKHSVNGDSCYDYGASIRNKPAESVLSYWFKLW
jgi:hypothetical protein